MSRPSMKTKPLLSLDTLTDEMLNAYTACALWSSMDNSDDQGGEPLDTNYDAADIHPDTLATMRADCAAFLAANAAILETCFGTADQAGHDFWLTRCGHGTGFWDRDDNVWTPAARDALSDYCRRAGNVDLYIGDDGLIHA